jgi:hypothetical protein
LVANHTVGLRASVALFCSVTGQQQKVLLCACSAMLIFAGVPQQLRLSGVAELQ